MLSESISDIVHVEKHCRRREASIFTYLFIYLFIFVSVFSKKINKETQIEIDSMEKMEKEKKKRKKKEKKKEKGVILEMSQKGYITCDAQYPMDPLHV